MNEHLSKANGTRWLEPGGQGATTKQLRQALREANGISLTTQVEAEFVLNSYHEKVVTTLALNGRPLNEADARRIKLVGPSRPLAVGRPRKNAGQEKEKAGS